MKSWFVCLLTLLILALPVQGVGETYNYILLDDSEAGHIRDVCPWEDGLALLGSTGVWYHQPETGEMTALLDFRTDLPLSTMDHSNLSRIFAQDGKLYVLDAYTPAVYRIEDRGALPCLEDAAGIFTYNDQGETLRKELVSCVAANDCLYLLLNSFTFEDGEVCELYKLNAAEGKITGLGRQDVDILYSAANGGLLAGKKTERGQTLCLIDPAANAIAALNDRAYPQDAAGFVWDDAADTLYYAAESGKVYAENAGRQDVIAYLPFRYVYSNASVFIWKNAYVYLQDSTLNIRSLDDAPDALVTLKILGGVSDSIIQQYMAENPNVSIILDPRESSFLGLQEALVSGDDSIDMFLVASNGIYTEVVDKGYAAPLSVSDDLTARVSHFYPWAQKLLVQHGELYAIPVTITGSYWTINRTKWNELGLGSYPQTYEELFGIARVWEEEYAENYPEYYVFECMDGMPGMIRTMVRQYLLAHENWTAPVDFNTPEFRNAIQSVIDHPGIFTYDGERTALIMSYPQYLGTGYNDDDVVESFLPPALTRDSLQVVGGTMELLVLNPSSAHQEEAIQFMEFYMAHLDAVTAYAIDASCTTPLRPDGHESSMQDLAGEIEKLEARIAAAAEPAVRGNMAEELETLQRRYARLESAWRISAEDIAIYQRIAEKIVIPVRTIYPSDGLNAEVFNTVIEQFAAGSMSLDQFIRTLNERANIMFLEAN